MSLIRYCAKRLTMRNHIFAALILSSACASPAEVEAPAPRVASKHVNKCAEYGACYGDPRDPSYVFIPESELGSDGDYENALDSPYKVAPTSYRPAVGQIGNCPVLWLTETYAVTVSHCADSNGVTSSDFTNNIADKNGMTMKLRDTNGLHVRSGNVDVRVVLHENMTPGVNPTNADDDIAMYRIKTNKWSIAKPGGDARARIYVDGMSYPGCIGNSYGNKGAATWRSGEDNQRAYSYVKYCSVNDYYSSTTGKELSNVTGALPGGHIIDYESGDSGGAVYITTSTTTMPAYVAIIERGSGGDTNNEYATALLQKNQWIKDQDTVLGGPAISSWTETRSIGSQNITVRYYTDSSET